MNFISLNFLAFKKQFLHLSSTNSLVALTLNDWLSLTACHLVKVEYLLKGKEIAIIVRSYLHNFSCCFKEFYVHTVMSITKGFKTDRFDLTGTKTLDMSVSGGNDSWRVLHTPQTSRTAASPLEVI